MGQQLLGNSCWYRDNCITKLWSLSSYFLYLYMVFIQHCFQLEQHCFHIDRQFSCSSKISNWLSRIPTQSILVIQNSCYSELFCTLSPLLYKCSVFSSQLLPLYISFLMLDQVHLHSYIQCLPTTDLLHTNQFCASYTSLNSLQNSFSLQCVWYVWYPYHY